MYIESEYAWQLSRVTAFFEIFFSLSVL